MKLIFNQFFRVSLSYFCALPPHPSTSVSIGEKGLYRLSTCSTTSFSCNRRMWESKNKKQVYHTQEQALMTLHQSAGKAVLMMKCWKSEENMSFLWVFYYCYYKRHHLKASGLTIMHRNDRYLVLKVYKRNKYGILIVLFIILSWLQC